MKDREKLILPKQEAIDILNEENPNFSIIENEICGKSRWSDVYRLIIERKSDHKFFKGGYRSGATENRDERPWEYQKDVSFSEVFQIEKTIVVYE